MSYSFARLACFLDLPGAPGPLAAAHDWAPASQDWCETHVTSCYLGEIGAKEISHLETVFLSVKQISASLD